MFKKNKIHFLLGIFLFLFLLLPVDFLFAQAGDDLSMDGDTPNLTNSFSDSEPDAIAIRIIPNPENYNIQQWYRMQGFTGSPQSLIIDGYKAIRDGRTVYISAANIDPEKKNIYFNIYLISYNQEADDNTIDIFGKILSNWKLNTNLKDKVGHCTISSKVCSSSSDCPSGYICGGYVSSNVDSAHLSVDSVGTDVNNLGKIYQKNRCIIKENDYNQPLVKTPACLLDSQCPNNLFCDSPKAKLIRDMDRLEKLNTIKSRLESYKNINGHYPILASGTYVPYVAISSWPSWQRVFLSQINASGLSDNINRISSCYDKENNFDLTTCWENNKSAFLSVKNPVNYTNFVLPEYSSVFSYVSDPAGQVVNLYSPMESSEYWGIDFNLPTGENTSDFEPPYIPVEGDLPQYNSPYFEGFSLSGHSGQNFEGYIKAKDPRGQNLTWSISNCILGQALYPGNTVVSNCSGFDWSKWTPNQLPYKINSNSDEMIYLRADKTGDSQSIDSTSIETRNKTYIIGVSVKNSSGYETIKNFPISVSNQNPAVQVSSSYGQNLTLYQDFSFPVSIADVSGLESVSLCHLDSSNNCLNTWNLNPKISNEQMINFTGSSLFNNKLIIRFTPLGNNNDSYSLKIENKHSLNTPGVFNSSHLGTHKFKITAKDPYGAQTYKFFNITFSAEPPVVMFNGCSSAVSLNSSYSCQISSNKPGENISVESLEKPDFLTFNNTSKTFSGTASSLGIKKIRVRITNDFGLSSEGTHNFSVYTKPTVETVSSSNISSSFFTCNGKINSTGGNQSGGHGCVASTNSSSLDVNNTSQCTSSNGCSYTAIMQDNYSFSHVLTGLNRNSTYYYRAYGTNLAGTSYGQTKSFKTRADYPALTVNQENLSGGNINFSGSLVDSGGGDTLADGGNILAMGFVWSTTLSSLEAIAGACSLNPDNCILASKPYNVGSFSKSVSASKFEAGKTYYFKSFAMNKDYVGERLGLSSHYSFTLPVPPSTSTTNPSNITSSSASSGGSINNPSSVNISECGLVYWSNDSAHIVPSTKIVSASCSSSFNLNVPSLSPGVSYSLKSYIISPFGTSYGESLSFTTKTIGNITYNGNGSTGGTPPATQTADSGTNVVISGQGSLVKTGNTFSGWSTNTSGTGTNYTEGQNIAMPSAGLNLYAKWNPYQSTINFDKQSGAGGSNSVTAYYGSNMPEASGPARSGYDFGGYYSAVNGGGTQYYTGGMTSARTWNLTSSPVTLYAKWTGSYYTVTFDKQGGTGGSNSVTANYGSPMPSATAPTKAGYTFDGYHDSSSVKVAYYSSSMSSVRNWDKTSNATLYAHWKTNNYTITFNANGGSGTMSSQTIASGATSNLNANQFIRTGYTFAGWATSSGGSVSYANGASYTMGTSNVTLYAVWTVATPISYTLSLTKSGDGVVSSSNVTIDGLFPHCNYDCYSASYLYNSGTTVTLSATSDFQVTSSWLGCSSYSGNNCTVVMNSNKSISVTFSDIPCCSDLPPGNLQPCSPCDTYCCNGVPYSGSCSDCSSGCTRCGR